MTKLYQRRAFVVIDSVSYEGLRLAFTVKKTAKPEPNEGEITVTNLSRESRSRIRKGSKVVLVAGYQLTSAVIFTGDVRTVDSGSEDGNIDTVIKAGDGDRAYRGDTVTASLPPGASLQDVVAKLAGTMGVDSARALQRMNEKGAEPGGLAAFSRGRSLTGKSSTLLSNVLKAGGLAWSIQDGELVILGPKETSPGQAVLLAPDSGLVRSPELQTKEDKGKPATVNMTSLLQPSIRPGSLLKVESLNVNGLFRAQQVEHKGDTHGDDWYTEIEALPL